MDQTSHAASLLSLSKIGKSYGGVRALSDVSFAIGQGEVVALAGDNGAGKSTLVKVVSGTILPDEGQILFDGKTALVRSPQDAADLGIQTVYQDLALCDNLDTVQNLFLGREIHSGAWKGAKLARPQMEQKAHDALSALNVRIRDYGVPVGRLSGGQRQSVAIARAVLSKPRVILLDEPTAALGVAQRAEVGALILRLRDQGLGVIIVSHDLGEVLEIADRVVVLRLGMKVAEAAARDWTRSGLVAAITGVAH